MKIQEVALRIRQEVFKMACRANGGHIAPAYSMTDIVAELYFNDILHYDPTNAEWQDIFLWRSWLLFASPVQG